MTNHVVIYSPFEAVFYSNPEPFIALAITLAAGLAIFIGLLRLYQNKRGYYARVSNWVLVAFGTIALIGGYFVSKLFFYALANLFI